ATDTARGTATATIVQPLRVQEKSELDFGEIECGSRDGKIVLSPQDRRNVFCRVDVEQGDFAPARFAISGLPFNFYDVTTPSQLIFKADKINKRDRDRCDDDHNHGKNHDDDRDQQSLLVVKDFTTYSNNLRDGGHRGFLGHNGVD